MVINSQIYKKRSLYNINNFIRDFIRINNFLLKRKSGSRDFINFNNYIKKIYLCKTEASLYKELVKIISELFENISGCLYVYNDVSGVWNINANWGAKSYGDDKFEIPLEYNGDLVASIILFSRKLSIPYLFTEFLEHFGIALNNIKEKDLYKKEANSDPLTGLYNRRYMEETIEREVSRAKRYKKDIGIILVDIDFFKQINDNFGHDAGDKALKVISDVLKSNIRSSDVICRFGGEEFILILPDISVDDCMKRAKTLLDKVRQALIHYQGYQIKMTASFGVSIFSHCEESLSDAINKADSALYEAKAGGRNKIVCNSSRMGPCKF